MLYQLFVEIWKVGMFSIFKLCGTIITLVILTQLCWMFYRWVTDAETEWPKEKQGKIFFFGKKMALGLGVNTGTEFTAVVGGTIVLSIALGILWPIAVVAGVIFGTGFGIRGAFRFKRKITKALEAKANVDHSHDGRYEKKADNGAVNL